MVEGSSMNIGSVTWFLLLIGMVPPQVKTVTALATLAAAGKPPLTNMHRFAFRERPYVQ